MRNNIVKIERVNRQLAKTIEDRGGFITSEDTEALIAIDSKMLCLVRTNAGRFICPIDCLAGYLHIIEDQYNRVKAETGQILNAGTDWVRDVSIMHNITCV